MHTTQVSITGEDDTKIVDNMTAALDELYSPAGNVRERMIQRSGSVHLLNLDS